MPQEWIQTAITCTTENREVLSDSLIGLGAAWVSIEGDRLIAYFPITANQEELTDQINESLRTLQESGINITPEEPSFRQVSDEGWAESWTEFFKPVKISPRIVVSPPWEEYDPAPGEEVLLIDPGMGFGTGGHETTRCCLRAIDELLSGNEKVLDVGTGSGILSIAAVKLGAAHAIALDVDPAALQNARHNAAINDCAGRITFAERSISVTDRGFNLVVANIFAETIVELAHLLKEAFIPGGHLVLSGIMKAKASLVEDTMSDLEQIDKMVEGNWVTLVYRKKKASN